MPKFSEIPIDDTKPNQSTIIINDGDIELYLFSDGFKGINGQTGYMRLENIFIRDNREGYKLPKPIDFASVKNYKNFFKGMIDEYNRHYPTNKDSYINCDIERLYRLLYNSFENTDLRKNSSHLFDIANFCMFLYAGLNRVE